MPLIDGLIIDKWGINKSIILCSSINLIGQLVITVGSIYHNFIVMVIGRGIFGIGSEMAYVVIPTLVTRWFLGKELSLELGFSQCFPFLVSYSTGFFVPSLYSKYGFGYTFGLGAATCLISLIGG